LQIFDGFLGGRDPEGGIGEERKEGGHGFPDPILQEGLFQLLGSRLLDLAAEELLPEGLGVRAPDAAMGIPDGEGGEGAEEASASFHSHRHLCREALRERKKQRLVLISSHFISFHFISFRFVSFRFILRSLLPLIYRRSPSVLFFFITNLTNFPSTWKKTHQI
jgi:hypothetical protein